MVAFRTHNLSSLEAICLDVYEPPWRLRVYLIATTWSKLGVLPPEYWPSGGSEVVRVSAVVGIPIGVDERQCRCG